MIGNIVASRWIGDNFRRRIVVAALLVLFGLLSLFPRQYYAAATMMPTDPSSLGLSGALGQLGAFNGLFGNQAMVEVSLKVARSSAVRRIVARKLDLVHKLDLSSEDSADRWLANKINIRALRGGIILIETKIGDPALGQSLVGAFADAASNRMAQISRAQTAYKRGVLIDLVREARDRLDRAQNAYDTFRRSSRFAAPQSSLSAIGERIPSIQAALRAKEIELKTARSFATDNNMSVRQILAEMAALRVQLQQAEDLNANSPVSVNRVVVQSTEVQELELELSISHTLYDSYRRFLEGTAVEDLTAAGNIRILEAPYIDTARQFRTLPLALFFIVLLLGLAIECYLWRPPLGQYAAARAMPRE